MPSDVTRSKIGDLAVRTEEVLLLLLSDVDDLKEKLEAETGNDQELGVFIYFIIVARCTLLDWFIVMGSINTKVNAPYLYNILIEVSLRSLLLGGET